MLVRFDFSHGSLRNSAVKDRFKVSFRSCLSLTQFRIISVGLVRTRVEFLRFFTHDSPPQPPDHQASNRVEAGELNKSKINWNEQSACRDFVSHPYHPLPRSLSPDLITHFFRFTSQFETFRLWIRLSHFEFFSLETIQKLVTSVHLYMNLPTLWPPLRRIG